MSGLTLEEKERIEQRLARLSRLNLEEAEYRLKQRKAEEAKQALAVQAGGSFHVRDKDGDWVSMRTPDKTTALYALATDSESAEELLHPDGTVESLSDNSLNLEGLDQHSDEYLGRLILGADE